jgi:cytochrome c oxidase subunit I+III
MADDLPPSSSVKRWLVTTNHKDVGVLYTITALFFLIFGGVLALLIRMQLWTPGPSVLAGGAYNEAVTTHGLLMVFWFLSPFALGFANYVVPLQIGAKDLAFPRLNALSYWFYLFSGLLLAVSFFQGGTYDAGWTMYAPLNVPEHSPAIGGTTAVLALLLFVFSVTVGTINFLVTIHRGRAEGMGMWNLPLFTWTILLTVWMMLFAFAALLAALLLLGSDRIIGTLYFTATDSGGGSLLWAHLFWFFGHPEVYIVFFPALGVMLEVFQTFCGRRLVGRKWVILAMVLIALQSFLVWMHHMFLTSINLEIKTLMMATTIGISLPFDLIVFALIYTMVKGRVQFQTPFLFSLGALLLFIVGGITGVFLGAVVLDYEFRGTYWVVAHFHYVMFGGATALFGALYYWYPKMTGRMYDEFLGKLHFTTFFIGFNLLYFPLFVAWETPRRVFEYNTALITWHQLATVGGFVVAGSFLIMFYNLYVSLWSGEPAPDNPWDFSRTAEWAIPSPPPLENWPGRATYETGSLSFVEIAPSERATDGGADTINVRRTSEPEEYTVHEEPHEDHASIWPFVIGVAAFFTFLGLSGFHDGEIQGMQYIILITIGILLSAYSLIGFGTESFHAPEAVVAERWPFEGIGKSKLGVWFFLVSDVVVFGAVIGAFVFIRVGMGWTAWETVPPDPLPGLVNTFVLLTSSFTVILALVCAKRKSKRGLLAALGATLLLGFTFLGIKAWEWNYEFSQGIFPQTSIEASVYYVTTGLHGVHVVLGLLIALFMVWRIYTADAYLEDHRPVEFFGLYWHFVDIVWVFLFPLFYLM